VGSDPLVADTDSEDLDGDGLSGIEEEALGTDPLVADTDGDGVNDNSDWCPLDSPDDVDGDGVCNSDDVCPADANDDSDGDGSCDSVDQCQGNDRSGDADLDGFCDDIDDCISNDAPGKAPCFVDDQGGCTFSTTGGTAPFGLGFITLGLLAIRRRRNS
jgi:MYXO-CTERM domain-containing protein